MRNPAAPVALVLAALAGCSTVHERSTLSLHELGDHLARSVCPGPPAKVEPVPNQHVPGQTDRLETRQCAGASSTLYVGSAASDPEGLAVAVEIRAAGLGLPAYLEIGQPIEKAARALGPPQSQTPGSVTYGLGLEGSDTLTVHHLSGRISSVQ